MRHVGDRERDDLGGIFAGARQPPALDARQMLADDIHLADRRARAEQRLVDRLLLGKADAVHRRDPVRRAATGEQHQQQIIRAGLASERERVSGALQAGFVRHGMAGLDHADASRRYAVAVAGGGDADQPLRIELEPIEIVPLCGRGHGARALSGGEADHAALRRGAQMRCENRARMGGGNGGVI